MAPLKSSLARTVGKLLGVQKDTDLSLRGAAQSSRIPELRVSATGGETFTDGGYKYHFYKTTGPNPFNVSAAGSVQYLLVGGGGGNGANNGGGGGGGALIALADTTQPVTVQDYTIVIGAGGPRSGSPSVPGSNGDNTSAFGITAKGGGGGGSGTSGDAQDSTDPGGGSGGGQSRNYAVGSGGTYGNPGGPSDGSTNGRSGGGGGAGGAGSPGANSLNGGPGAPVTWCPAPLFAPMPADWKTAVGPTGLFAGGGGGNNEPGSDYTVAGGPGGGGDGSQGTAQGSPGTANTGGGAGGDMGGGENGGSGFVVIRYQV